MYHVRYYYRLINASNNNFKIIIIMDKIIDFIQVK